MPVVRAIVASGSSDDAVLPAAEAHGFVAAVSKPFDLDEIRSAVAGAFASDERPCDVGHAAVD